MPPLRAVLVALVAVVSLTVSGCAAASQTTSASSTSIPAASQTAPADGLPTGAAGGGGTGRTMTAEATARMAGDLGVTPTALTAAITKARSGGAGVKLVKALSSELNLSETKVAAELKAMARRRPDRGTSSDPDSDGRRP